MLHGRQFALFFLAMGVLIAGCKSRKTSNSDTKAFVPGVMSKKSSGIVYVDNDSPFYWADSDSVHRVVCRINKESPQNKKLARLSAVSAAECLRPDNPSHASLSRDEFREEALRYYEASADIPGVVSQVENPGIAELKKQIAAAQASVGSLPNEQKDDMRQHVEALKTQLKTLKREIAGEPGAFVDVLFELLEAEGLPEISWNFLVKASNETAPDVWQRSIDNVLEYVFDNRFPDAMHSLIAGQNCVYFGKEVRGPFEKYEATMVVLAAIPAGTEQGCAYFGEKRREKFEIEENSGFESPRWCSVIAETLKEASNAAVPDPQNTRTIWGGGKIVQLGAGFGIVRNVKGQPQCDTIKDVLYRPGREPVYELCQRKTYRYTDNLSIKNRVYASLGCSELSSTH